MKKALYKVIANRQESDIYSIKQILNKMKQENEQINNGQAYELCLEIYDKLSLLSDAIWSKYDNEPEELELKQPDYEKYPCSGRKWTREDDEKIEFLYKAGKTAADLAEIFGRPPKAIAARLQKLGL